MTDRGNGLKMRSDAQQCKLPAADQCASRIKGTAPIIPPLFRHLQPDYELWRDFPYEYEYDRLAIDLINGGEQLRQWVDDPQATPGDLEALAGADELAWMAEREAVILYR